jgi:hypothetical protein
MSTAETRYCEKNLTSALSKFLLYVVLPFVVAAPRFGLATVPPASASAPVGTPSMPLGTDNFIGAPSRKYGGGTVVVAASDTAPFPATATPPAVSN